MRRIESVTKAYHSTKQKGLKKFESRTTTATIDTGEGAHVHGWGLYLQADEMENREMYLYMFTGNSMDRHNKYLVTAWGDQYEAICSDDICDIDDFNSFDVYDFSSVNGNSHLTTAGGLYLNLKVYGYTNPEIKEMLTQVIEEIPSLGDDDDQFPEILIHWSEDDLKEVVRMASYGIPDYDAKLLPGEDPETLDDGTHYAEASQYTVEIPDDMIFIDEDKQVPNELVMTFVDTLVSVHTDYDYHGTDKSFYGKKNYSCKDIAEGKFSAEDVYIPNNCPEDLEDLLRTRQKEFVEDLYGKREAIINNVITDDGRSFYSRVSRTLGGEEKASLWLAEHGIDGMTYEGGRDHGCFVIYNCDKLKIVGEY